MNKLIIAALFFVVANNINGSVVVKNYSPYPIKFKLSWVGKTPYAGLSSKWVDSAEWAEVINPGRRLGKGGELLNLKSGYIVKALINGKWNEVLNVSVTDPADRIIDVKFENGVWKLDSKSADGIVPDAWLTEASVQEAKQVTPKTPR